MPDRKILVVDDNPTIIRALTFTLKKEGYNVSSVTNGEEALEEIKKSKPALIFLDIMMPKKNGYEVCQEIKSDPELKDIHVLMLTAKGQQRDRNKGLEVGVDEYMTKPFSPSKVVARVRDILG